MLPLRRPVGRALCACALAAGGCDHKHDAAAATPHASASSAAHGLPASNIASARASAEPANGAAPSSTSPRASNDGNSKPGATGAAPALETHAFVLDDFVDVAPAGPASASDIGVVLFDKSDHLAVARRGPLATSARPLRTDITSIARDRQDFSAYGRGPAIAAGFAYWTSQNRLLRARIEDGAAPELLASDARNGARVSAVATQSGSFVAYITTPDSEGAAHAKLWTEGGKVYRLTPEGAGTSSVVLLAQRASAFAISLDGRSGMTPLHVRRVEHDAADVLLGPDVVAWVGASAQGTTEVFAAANGDDVWAFVPIEEDVVHFGLAQIHVGSAPRLDAPAHFLTYPNGTNSAPVATGPLCGASVVAFAEPVSANASTPQELRLATLGNDGLDAGQVIAHGHVFGNVSLAELSGGALLVYTADHRTWAATLRCSASSAAASPETPSPRSRSKSPPKQK